VTLLAHVGFLDAVQVQLFSHSMSNTRNIVGEVKLAYYTATALAATLSSMTVHTINYLRCFAEKDNGKSHLFTYLRNKQWRIATGKFLKETLVRL